MANNKSELFWNRLVLLHYTNLGINTSSEYIS